MNRSPNFHRKEELPNELEKLADEKSPGFIEEIWYWLSENKVWWLAPIIILLVVVSLLVILSGSALAPALYTFW